MKYKKVKLKDIADIVMGQSPKSQFYNTDGKGIPFLQGVRTFGENYPIVIVAKSFNLVSVRFDAANTLRYDALANSSKLSFI